jgi:AbrB family looped-hinge helix DNA binding protein
MNPVGEQFMPLVRVKQKFQVTLPAEVREQLDIGEGDLLEATVQGDSVVLKPKVIVDREHVEAAIAEGLRDYAEGRVEGPFNTVEEFKASLK